MRADSKQIFLLWGDPKERMTLYKILAATGAEVRFADPANQITGANIESDCKLVIVDYDSVRADAQKLLDDIAAKKLRTAVVVLTSTRDKADLIKLLSHEVLTNVVAKNTDLKTSDIVVTAQKIIRNDVFGFEKYLSWGIDPHEQVLTSSDQKAEALDRVEDYLNSIGCNKRLVALAKGVGDEFIMNAVYNAPVDREGLPKYAARSRAEPVHLEKGEEVTFRYAYDGRVLAISISDNFGRLSKQTVLSYLRKCFMRGENQIDDKDGGAGLGFYYIFESLNEFIINVAPGKRTEMIGIMDVSGSYRDFADRAKSLNIFIEESRP